MKFDSRILVTGAAGLFGSALVEYLRGCGFINVIELSRAECDLMSASKTEDFFNHHQPEYVFHAAARVYGIMGNIKNKASSFYENVIINTNVVDASRKIGVKKITVMGSGAIYPYPSPGLPLKENMIFLGEPHVAHNSYAHAKRAMLAMLRAYEESYGLNWAYIVSCNLFGPRDKFDLEFGNVMPSLIRKFFEAKKTDSSVIVWGNGSAQRDFMFVKDAARINFDVMNKLKGAVNIGSGLVYSIRDIVDMLEDITDMKGKVQWDSEKPNGQDYRAYDLSKIRSIGFECEYTIRKGLEETWSWYCNNHS